MTVATPRTREPSYPLDPALDLLQCIWRVTHSVECLSMRMEARIGVTAQQRLVIRCVGKYPGITAGQLAVVLQLDPGSVSATLKRLEARDLLTRRRDPSDRRRVTLGLTARGLLLHQPMEGTLEHAVEKLLKETEAADLSRAKALLVRLSELVEAEG